ncbi:MAG: helix-turn-helix domain-containing protein [Anaerolineales bacterium]|nr:helix-turn-helix domain-containing protein [Anaerolineales bacterium]
MSFSDAAARMKKINAAKEEAEAQAKQVDLEELYALRARMLGVLVRDARVASGYAVEDIADTLNVAAETVVNWEFGREAPSLPQLELLAYFLQIPVSHFWGSETLLEQQTRRSIDGDEYQAVRNHMIGIMLRTQREALQWTVEQVAEAAGLDSEIVALYEQGQASVPMTVITALASVLKVNLSYFLEDTGRIATFFEVREALKAFEEMPEDIREFVSKPSNQAYIRVAMSLAHMPTEALRALAEGLLDITL